MIEIGTKEDQILAMSNAYFTYNDCTEDSINEFLKNMAVMLGEFDIDIMFDLINNRHSVEMLGSSSVLEDKGDHTKWFNETTGDGYSRAIKWHFWKYYRELLIQKGLSSDVIDEIDDITNKILAKIEDPERLGEWDRRGLIMGSVQSGKTANYTGVIAKAIDSGYKFIIVLTGVHNSLRSQTQIRINEELIGKDIAKALKINDLTAAQSIGVGRLKGHNKKPIQTITTSPQNGDFRRNVALSVGFMKDIPHVFVIKKHVSIMKNLLRWIQSQQAEKDKEGRLRIPDIPLLVIDDECDQASVNTKKKVVDPDTGIEDPETNPTLTNQRIRELLMTFDKSAYIGYTATPYANIFIDSDSVHEKYGPDIFPRNFIFNLAPPENYIGPDKVFGLKEEDPSVDSSLPLTVKVKDADSEIPPKHKKDLIVNTLPPSLKKAIKQFVLSCAARRHRKTTNPHNSMLVHVTRFTLVQSQITDLVSKEIRHIKARIANSSDKLEDLEKIWNEEFIPVSDKLFGMKKLKGMVKSNSWDDIKKFLSIMVQKISVKQINGTSKDVLDYKEYEDDAKIRIKKGEKLDWEEKGLHVIAIGGNKLSRGLTLEGLSFAYYLRPSSMYDTLMQMGRWFGYREGYLDLCRINTTPEIIGSFRQIASAENDLRERFEIMAAIGAEPMDFGLAVQEDPGMLMVTNLSKRRGTVVMKLRFSGTTAETISFDPNKRKTNLKALEVLILNLQSKGKKYGKKFHWREVEKSVIIDFLEAFGVHKDTRTSVPANLAKFIKLQKKGELEEWDVFIYNRKNASRTFDCEGLTIGCALRNALDATPEKVALRRIVNPSDERIDLSAAAWKRCKEKWSDAYEILHGNKPAPNKMPSGPFIRAERPKNRGLLLIYGICGKKKKPYGLGKEDPYYGFAVSFPHSDTSESVRYRGNKKWAEEEGLF